MFRDSYVLCYIYMNIICPFRISVSGYGTSVDYDNDNVYTCIDDNENDNENTYKRVDYDDDDNFYRSIDDDDDDDDDIYKHRKNTMFK